MAREKLYRPATVSKAQALADLFDKRPGVVVESFNRVSNNNGKIVADENGSLYEVTVKTAGDFPPSDDESSSEDGGEAPELKEPKEESSDEGSSDDDGDEGGSPDGPPAAEGGDEGGLPKPKKLNPQEETVSLLRQILHALQGGAGPGAGGPGPDADLSDPGALPDVGAPPAGGGLPHGKGGPPLPPPVPNPKHGPGMGGAFSHVAEPFRVAASARDKFDFVREEANTMSQRALIAEAASLIPTHKVTKVNRNADGSATLEMSRR